MKISVFILVLMGLLLNGCISGSEDPAEKYKKMSEKKLFSTAVASVKSENYENAIEQFEALDAGYPFGKYAERAQFYTIYVYYKQNKYPESLAATDRFIHLHPDAKHVDYAYYMQALVNYQQNLGVFERFFPSDVAQRDLQPARQSYLEFMSLIDAYPNSPYSKSAAKYVVYIRNLIADRGAKVAQFYLDRKAYVAAIRRANDVILHYQGAPAVRDALKITIKSYRALHLDSLADLYVRVEKLNYSD